MKLYATTDALAGILNRRAELALLEKQIELGGNGEFKELYVLLISIALNL